MDFTINHARAFVGNDVYVKVVADAAASLSMVQTVLDGFELANDTITAGGLSYERVFPRAGDAGSGKEHSLVVTATQADGASHSATSIWTDPV